MSFIMRPVRFASTGHIIEGSGLFDGDSGTLTRTPVAGNTKIFTISTVVKFSAATGTIFFGGTNFSNNFDILQFSSGMLDFQMYHSSAAKGRLRTTQLLRDTSAYYHIIVAVNTNAAIAAANRLRMYINGVEITDFETRTNPGDNQVFLMNSAVTHSIGAGIGNYYASMYMANFTFIDGLQLTPLSFGQTTEDGYWQINDASDLTFGTNGFLLEGGANVSIGNDTSIGAALTGAWESSAVSAANVANGGTYTFSSQDIGTAASNRNIIVVASTGGGGAGIDFAATCTVGGASIARIVDLEGNDNNDISVYQGVIASGTSADVVITVAGGTMEKCGIAVHAVFGDKVSLNDLYTQAATTAAPSGSVDVPAGGVIIAANKIQSNDGAFATSWTNATEVYDEVLEAGTNADMQSGAYTAVTSAATVTVTATASGATLRNSLVVMSFSTGNNFRKAGTITATNDSPTNGDA